MLPKYKKIEKFVADDSYRYSLGTFATEKTVFLRYKTIVRFVADVTMLPRYKTIEKFVADVSYRLQTMTRTRKTKSMSSLNDGSCADSCEKSANRVPRYHPARHRCSGHGQALKVTRRTRTTTTTRKMKSTSSLDDDSCAESCEKNLSHICKQSSEVSTRSTRMSWTCSSSKSHSKDELSLCVTECFVTVLTYIFLDLVMNVSNT